MCDSEDSDMQKRKKKEKKGGKHHMENGLVSCTSLNWSWKKKKKRFKKIMLTPAAAPMQATIKLEVACLVFQQVVVH